jgi:hypothetical protein
MRKLVTIAATALTLSGLALATPSFAAGNDFGGNGQHGRYQDNDRFDHERGGYNDRGYDDRGRGRGGDRHFDFDRHDGNFDRWERGWGDRGHGEFRHHRPLSYWQLVRRLEHQGYYGVRGLRKSRWGWGYRAFAFTGRGRPVMLRINPYSGRVINVRYV